MSTPRKKGCAGMCRSYRAASSYYALPITEQHFGLAMVTADTCMLACPYMKHTGCLREGPIQN